MKSKGDSEITMTSGNVYRIKPDGSRIEYVTHGQVNPFGLTFDPLGNLYSCDCHSRPVYQLLKGAYYPSFGRPDDGLGFGPELLTHDHGSTAIAGITYYAADQFPPEYRGNTFIGNVVTNRVNRDRMESHGSTYKGIEMPDFLKCDDPWFRPVDIKLGPDGALYVADFYNRIIGHYEVPLNHPGRDHTKGRIWRIVYRGTDGQTKLKPFRDLTTATTPELIGELNNTNLAVRMQTTEQLIARASEPATVESVQHVVEQGTSFEKAHAMWVLERARQARTGNARQAGNGQRPTGARPCHAAWSRKKTPGTNTCVAWHSQASRTPTPLCSAWPRRSWNSSRGGQFGAAAGTAPTRSRGGHAPAPSSADELARSTARAACLGRNRRQTVVGARITRAG